MPWDSSNPLYRWKQKHGKLNKSAKRTFTKVKTMAKKQSRRRRFTRFRRRHVKAPIAILPLLGGVVAPMVVAIQKSNFISDVQSDPMKAVSGLADQICQRYTGFSPLYGQTWSMQPMIETYTGLLAGVAGHMLANKFGVNRTMKRVPFIGKYIQL
jgi:hypothetical protein